MTTTRTPTIRAFPLTDPNYIAVGSTHFKDIKANSAHKNLFYTLTLSPWASNLDFSSRTVLGMNINSSPRVLPSGYYFYDQQIFANIDSNKVVKVRTAISNILHHMLVDTICVTQDIDASLAAEIQVSDKKVQIAAVTKDRKKVFLYHIGDAIGLVANPPGVIGQRFSPLGKTVTSIENIHALNDNETRIHAMVGFTKFDSVNPQMVLAYSSGEIVMGEIAKGKFQQGMTLLKLSAEKMAKIQLLSTPDGKLMMHDTEENKLFIWNLAVCFKYEEYPCPKMYNLSVSADGKYLTAIDQDHDSSYQVYCFELTPFKQHVIQLDQPVADFIIGQDNIVYVMHQSDLAPSAELDFHRPTNFPGKIDVFLPKPKEESRLRSFLGKLVPHRKDSAESTTQRNKP